MKIKDIVIICHEGNRTLCQINDEKLQISWKKAPEWQKISTIEMVEFCLKNPNAPDSACHDNWMKKKLKDGWTFGTIKDPDKKIHPCLVSFDQLPRHQQAKDALFASTVKALSRFID